MASVPVRVTPHTPLHHIPLTFPPKLLAFFILTPLDMMQEMMAGVMMDSALVLDQAPTSVQLHITRIMKTTDVERDATLFCTSM